MAKHNEYRTVTMNFDVYKRLDALREERRKRLGLRTLSWSEFMGMIEGQVREDEKKASTSSRR